MRTIEVKLFEFDELSDKAKEKAREWYREVALDYDWWDATYEDFVRICEILGVEIGERSQGYYTVGAPSVLKHRTEKQIWFSGFYSQGDGACFEGRYRYAEGAPARIREYASQDEELHRIADELSRLQTIYQGALWANITHRGHYYHARSMDFEVSADRENGKDLLVILEDEEALREALRDLARWLYKTLEAEHDYLLSDEVVDESIQGNEYEFLEDGRRA